MFEQINNCTEEVYSQLRKLIVTKKLIPGEAIGQRELSQILNTNDDCLKLAIKRLCKETLVIMGSNKEVMVREVETKEIIDVLDCRIALEAKAVKLFTLNASQARIDDLRNLMVPFENGPQNAHVFQKIDRLFHELIVKNCGNSRLIELFMKANFWSALELLGTTRSLKEILQEHLDIISAIHNRDVDKAVLLMRRHLENCKTSVL